MTEIDFIEGPAVVLSDLFHRPILRSPYLYNMLCDIGSATETELQFAEQVLRLPFPLTCRANSFVTSASVEMAKNCVLVNSLTVITFLLQLNP
jgi:hypothetical protein